MVEFLRKAAKDPDVVAIKMTLYRLGRNSPIVEALLEAVENGKQVAVLVELKARFDEESNIEWARALEREGVHVVYGLLGLKVHSQNCAGAAPGGGCYPPLLSLGHWQLQSGDGAAVHRPRSSYLRTIRLARMPPIFLIFLPAIRHKKTFRKLLVAPLNLRQRLEELIQREIDLQRNGGDGQLIFKMNALEDGPIIRLLYQASQAGVHVDLIVRGACCLRPNVAGVSDNIHVSSIVGRFLEHSRIYYFANNGGEECYLGSADLMPRNLNRRVEVIFPVERPQLVQRLKDEILHAYLHDNRNARRMHKDGTYKHKSQNGGHDSQAWFLGQRSARPVS